MHRLFEGLVWSAAGFVVGFSLCWLVMRSVAINTMEGAVSFRRSRRFEVLRVVIGVMLLLMVVLSGIRYYQTTKCQQEYNRAVSESLTQRSEAQRQEGLAQIELLTASLSGDRDAAIRETHEYIAAVTELERVRAASPLPPPPNCRDFS